MNLSLRDPEVYPDLSGELESTGELSGLDRALLRSIEVEVAAKKHKAKGSRSKPKRGHKKPARRKNINRRKKAQGG